MVFLFALLVLFLQPKIADLFLQNPYKYGLKIIFRKLN